MRVETRETRPETLDPALPEFLRKALAARGTVSPADLQLRLAELHPPQTLPDIERAAERLATAVEKDERTLIVGDFDADGATASALCVSLLRAFGADERNVGFLVPNRFEFGYGLTPELVRVALEREPQVLVTVDNGVSSIDGVELARAAGVDVVVTDHHLPGETLPAAFALVNPNLADSAFPSPHLAGVGVAYYLMGAVRGVLRTRGHFDARPEPNLADWLDLVAVGTVADVVPLDRNNRILVHQGLRRIRAGRARPGIQALVQVAGRAQTKLVASDLGFAIGPRLNAAGRLQDMALGIECLLEDDPAAARKAAESLDALNVDRRQIEAEMSADALALVEEETVGDAVDAAVCVYQPGWHQGVVGIVAARLRERYHRPAVVFADDDAAPDLLKGSARSIPGLHIRDAIADCAARYPGLVGAFGGHAMAAGLSVPRIHLPRFRIALKDAVASRVDERTLAGIATTDGELPSDEFSVANAQLISRHGPWGPGFEEPSFHGEFEVVTQRVVGERHLKLVLKQGGRVVDAIAFNQAHVNGKPAAKNSRMERVAAVYRLGINDYDDAETFQLQIDRLEAL